MTHQQAGELLRRVESVGIATAQGGAAWRWAKGVMLFPEAVCPLCKGGMRSNRIWVVDEVRVKLAARYKVAGGEIVREVFSGGCGRGGLHPHCYEADGIGPWGVCLGDRPRAESVAYALFSGIYVRGSMWPYHHSKEINEDQMTRYWKPWLAEVFDHVCEGKHRQRKIKGVVPRRRRVA